MDANNIISFALSNNLISYYNNSENEFILNDTIYSYDYENPNMDLIKRIKSELPIIEIIDLVTESIYLGVATDVSEDYKKSPLLSFDSYEQITNQNVFYFRVNSETYDDITYSVTFNKSKHDIKKKIEYASRTSEFVDTLIKRIMAKYNILLVRRANFETNEIPQMPESQYFESKFSHVTDTQRETNMIQNQLKVLVNYRDNFNNTTCSENVIDDIFISIDGSDVSYGFYEIGQTEAEPVYDVINETVEASDIDSLLRIRNLIKEPEVKFNVFETLRKNNSTNLSMLMQKRLSDYDSTLNQEPKVEFTITPLSIYCNHIVEKSCIYEIRSKNEYFKEYKLDYELSYNPANVKEAFYTVDLDGYKEKGLLNENTIDDLVLAFNDVPLTGNVITPIMTTKHYAVMLYGFNEKFNSDIYKDVYFLKDSLVKLINGRLEPFDGNLDDDTYLKSQIVKGEITGTYYYIEDTAKVARRDVLGLGLDDQTQGYIHKSYLRKCDVCGHEFGCTEDIWNMYKLSHTIVNSEDGISCCDYCANEDDNVKYKNHSILHSYGQNKYFYDDLDDLKNTDICIACSEKEKSLLFVNLKMKPHLPNKCSVCKRYYCQSHIDPETSICINCSNKAESHDLSNLDKRLRTQLRLNMRDQDLIKKGLKYHMIDEHNVLWVYVPTEKALTTYYFITDDSNKFVHLEKVYKVKR